MSYCACHAFEQFEKRYLGLVVTPGKTRAWRSLDPLVEREIWRSWSTFISDKSPEAKKVLQHSWFKVLGECPEDFDNDVTEWITFLRSWLICCYRLEPGSSLNEKTSDDDDGIVVLKRGERHLNDDHIEFMQIICDILKCSYRVIDD
jgi:hypothetical protein